MFFRILIKYILGYINIKIEGYFVEKFINKCINENIFFWNVKREKSTIVYINTGIKDFKRLCRIARECKCKIQIKEKKGLPFITIAPATLNIRRTGENTISAVTDSTKSSSLLTNFAYIH